MILGCFSVAHNREAGWADKVARDLNSFRAHCVQVVKNRRIFGITGNMARRRRKNEDDRRPGATLSCRCVCRPSCCATSMRGAAYTAMSSRAWTVRRRSGACFFWAWDLSGFVLSIPRTRQPSKVRRFLYSNFIGAEQLTGGLEKEPARTQGARRRLHISRGGASNCRKSRSMRRWTVPLRGRGQVDRSKSDRCCEVGTEIGFAE